MFWFANNGEPQLYLASADLMERNLDRRVEAAFPIEGKKLQQRVRQALDLYLADNTNASMLQADGEYLHSVPGEGEAVHDVQSELLEKLCGLGLAVGH